MNFKIGDFDITVVAMYNDILNENNCSVIIKAECDSKRFLFMGDAESGTERKLIKDKKDIDCDVLKVGHHGSNTSTTADLLRNASPKMAVISVGTNNMYHHPHAATITQLKHNRINVYRTDKQGDITFHIENNKIRVKTEK